MMRIAWLLVLVGCLVACGDNLPAGVEAVSGSRLKLMRYVYEGGASELEQVLRYDTVLQERCFVASFSDGARYCMPLANEAVYVSDTCTRALGRRLIGLPSSPYFMTRFWLAADPRPLPSRLFRPGPPVQTPVAIWQKHADVCVGPMVPGDNFEYFELGEELPVEDLVRIRRGEPQGSGDIALGYDTSEDGYRVPAAVHDGATGEPCQIDSRPNAETIDCEPGSPQLASYYHDAACTEPEISVHAGAPTPAVVRHDNVETSCRRYYRVGSEVSAPPLYARTDSGCLAIEPPDDERFFTMAGAQPLPRFMRLREVTPHRIRPIARVHDDLRVADPWMYDAELDTDCGIDDARERCVPRATIAVQPFFADAQCQTPIDLALVPSGACDPSGRFAQDSGRFYPLLAPYTGTIYVPSTGDTCAAARPPVPLVAYTLGPALDDTRFATAKLQIDP